jgi:hypothetical protein
MSLLFVSGIMKLCRAKSFSDIIELFKDVLQHQTVKPPTWSQKGGGGIRSLRRSRMCTRRRQGAERRGRREGGGEAK